MPEKANAHFVRCDRWWLVTPRRANSQSPIAKAGEIPGPWGWMAIDPKGEVIVYKKAPKLVPAVQFDRAFAFALVRAAARHDREAIKREVDKRMAERKDDFTQRVNSAAARIARPESNVNEALMAKLREAFGPSISWIGEQAVVDAIKAVHQLRSHGSLHEAVKSLREVADKVDRAVEALHGLKEHPE